MLRTLLSPVSEPAVLPTTLSRIQGERDGAQSRALLAEEAARALLHPALRIIESMGRAAYGSEVLDSAHRDLRAALDAPGVQVLLTRWKLGDNR